MLVLSKKFLTAKDDTVLQIDKMENQINTGQIFFFKTSRSKQTVVFNWKNWNIQSYLTRPSTATFQNISYNCNMKRKNVNKKTNCFFSQKNGFEAVKTIRYFKRIIG